MSFTADREKNEKEIIASVSENNIIDIKQNIMESIERRDSIDRRESLEKKSFEILNLYQKSELNKNTIKELFINLIIFLIFVKFYLLI
jgi:hypothetical protein